MTPLTLFETADARSNSYLVFSRLFDVGVTTETLPYATAIAELRVALPERYDADAAAAAHHVSSAGRRC